jgi:cytochrome P450
MILHPDIQARAQEEIDRVIGQERLPSFKDRNNLPYLEAVIKECLRWHAVVPAGLYLLPTSLKTFG